MSIADQITRIKNNVASAYAAAEKKGGTLPAEKTSDRLAACIESIPAGGDESFPPFTLSDMFAVDAEGNLTTPDHPFELDGTHAPWSRINSDVLRNRYANNTGLTRVSFPNLTEVNGNYAMD